MRISDWSSDVCSSDLLKIDRLWKQALHLIVSISHQGDTFMADARIFEDLKRDHDRHRQLLAQLAHIQGNGEERRSLFETLRKELQAHAAAEEESLYATMRQEEHTPELQYIMRSSNA